MIPDCNVELKEARMSQGFSIFISKQLLEFSSSVHSFYFFNYIFIEFREEERGRGRQKH